MDVSTPREMPWAECLDVEKHVRRSDLSSLAPAQNRCSANIWEPVSAPKYATCFNLLTQLTPPTFFSGSFNRRTFYWKTFIHSLH